MSEAKQVDVVIDQATTRPYPLPIEGCELLFGTTGFHYASHARQKGSDYYKNNPYKLQKYKRNSVANIAHQDARFLVPKGTTCTLTVTNISDSSVANFGSALNYPFSTRLWKDSKPITSEELYKRLGSRSEMLHKFLPRPNEATEKLFNVLQYFPTASILPLAIFKTLFDCTYECHIGGNRLASFFTLLLTGPLAALSYAYHYTVQLASIALSHASLGLTIYANLILKSNGYVFLATTLLSAMINVFAHIYKNPLWTADDPSTKGAKFRSVLIALIDSMTLKVPALHAMNDLQGLIKCFVADPLHQIHRQLWIRLRYKNRSSYADEAIKCDENCCACGCCNIDRYKSVINGTIKGLSGIGLPLGIISTYFAAHFASAVANAIGYTKYFIYGGVNRLINATALALTGGGCNEQEFKDSGINLAHFFVTLLPHLTIGLSLTKLIPHIESITGLHGFGPWCGAFYLLGTLAVVTQGYDFIINALYDNNELRSQGKQTLSWSYLFPKPRAIIVEPSARSVSRARSAFNLGEREHSKHSRTVKSGRMFVDDSDPHSQHQSPGNIVIPAPTLAMENSISPVGAVTQPPAQGDRRAQLTQHHHSHSKTAAHLGKVKKSRRENQEPVDEHHISMPGSIPLGMT